MEYQMFFDSFLEVFNRKSVILNGGFQEVVMGTSESFQETLRRFIEGYLEVLKRSS